MYMYISEKKKKKKKQRHELREYPTVVGQIIYYVIVSKHKFSPMI